MAAERQSSGRELERFRAYLRLLARLDWDQRFQAKLDASDLVQQTLLEAYRSLKSFRGQSEPELAGWLRQILAFQMKHAARDLGRGKRDVARERSLDDAMNASSVRLGAWLAADQSSPSEKAQRKEQAVQLAAALEELPQDQREVLVMHYLQGCTLPQISKRMGRSPAAVAGLLQRGLKDLRRLMSSE